MSITTKQFQLSEDLALIWDFLTDMYEKGADNGVAAPFFEYAMHSNWMDKSYTDLDRLWFDGDKVVALVFYEDPVTNIFFNVRRGYEFLVDEMIDYAVEKMPNFDDQQQFVLFGGQECLKKAAEKRGYRQVFEYEDRVFDFENEFFFVRVHFARHDLIDLFTDIFGVFFCQILDSVFHLYASINSDLWSNSICRYIALCAIRYIALRAIRYALTSFVLDMG